MSSSNYSLILRMTHVLNAKLMVRGRLEAGDITGKSQNRYFRLSSHPPESPLFSLSVYSSHSLSPCAPQTVRQRIKRNFLDAENKFSLVLILTKNFS